MRSAALLAVLGLASPYGQAELVGEHVAILGSDDALIVHLNDAPSEQCPEGVYPARLGATSSQIFPQIVHYADGCWYVTRSGNVVIDAKTREHMPVHLEYSVTDFVTTPAFKDWARFTGF